MKKMDDEELISVIEEVDQIRLDSVKDKRFLDAENSKQKLKQLREILEQKKKVQFKENQKMEKIRLEEDFMNEMESFSEHWNSKIQNYQEECKQMENELIEHNKAQLEEYRDYLDENLPKKPKDSSKLINLKHQIEQLVKKQDYKDAHYLQQKAYELEKREYDKFIMEREKKLSNLLEQKINFHQNEYNSLRKRILNGLDELELQRKREYERLFLKYKNLKKNIENHQAMESIMLEKSMAHSNLHQSIKNFYVSNPNKENKESPNQNNDAFNPKLGIETD